MPEQIEYKSFDAATVMLHESNLIEASAGTGKTYSIAILVLRLLLEKQVTIRQILMVTFTKAAVAELEERIRLFIRSAYKASQGKSIKDENIKALVQRAAEMSGAKQVEQQLKDAILFLDETSVLTIHSFCQQTLNEFAFETNQLFGAEMIPDIRKIIEDELNKSWRKNITTMPVNLLNAIWNSGMKAALKKAIEQHLSGKRYFGYDKTTEYKVDESHHREWLNSIASITNNETKLRQELVDYVVQNTEQIIKNTTNKTAQNNVLPFIKSPEDFLMHIWKKRTSAYIPKSFPELLTRLEACDDCGTERDSIIQTIISQVNFLVIQEVSKGVANFKLRNNLLSYDDMIQNLHVALVGRDNPILVRAMQDKYKAVFIDEFQDTDRQQFEIFDKAFGTNTILFYIGDPKQSIYAWRKADIFTYFKARNAVQHLYGMNHNYRSNASLITAMNHLFLPVKDFDTFFFNGDKDAITYHPVESPEPNTKGAFLKGGEPDVPISIFNVAGKDEMAEAVSFHIAQLLWEQTYQLKVKQVSRNINPSDIGVLVRKADQGRDVKSALAKLGIPAVTIDDSKVLQSKEATHVLYLIEAMATPDRSTINRALLSPFTGLDTRSILLLDDEITLKLFNNYKLRWQQDGIYTAIMDFVTDFGVRKILLPEANEAGERVITNMFQVAELLHQEQSRKNSSMTELISWLKRNIDGMESEGDEYTQRIESDEEAVKIVTIHKSKGLEYNIVFAPFLDLVQRDNYSFFSFRDPGSGDYVGVEKDRLNDHQVAWYSEQAEQENRRLLYVTITRAVYKCIIFRNESKYTSNSTLSTFLRALHNTDPEFIQFEKDSPVLPVRTVKKTMSGESVRTNEPVNFHLLEQNWRKMSYTMLAAKGDISPRLRSYKHEDAYETFILHTLKRGAKTGNLLHYIFENINFSNDAYWNRVLKEAIRRFVPGQQELYLPMLHQLLRHVFDTEIIIDDIKFSLAEVAFNKRIAEFEFDFPVPEFFPDLLNDLSDELASINVRNFHDLSAGQLEGIMNGKIDLFFEHLGRYYILDWKSNYLGPTADDYAATFLTNAMNESNYHLQYLIYAVAAKKYLESRLPSFDYTNQFGGVMYLFVRGMRAGKDTGIFTCKPSLERISRLEAALTYRILRTE
jgi:exodeoxyribonuclease V beta subunit